MRAFLLKVSGFIVLLMAQPGVVSAGLFFQRTPSSIYSPTPTYRWGLANPHSLPAPSDYLQVAQPCVLFLWAEFVLLSD